MIKIGIIKGINSGYTKKYRISEVNLSSKGEITSIKNNSKKRAIVFSDYFCFETLDVPMRQEVIDAYDMINMDIKYAFLQTGEARVNEINKILTNEVYYPYLLNYWWLINYASKDACDSYYDMQEECKNLIR
jgi:hypothetical protein